MYTVKNTVSKPRHLQMVNENHQKLRMALVTDAIRKDAFLVSSWYRVICSWTHEEGFDGLLHGLPWPSGLTISDSSTEQVRPHLVCYLVCYFGCCRCCGRSSTSTCPSSWHTTFHCFTASSTTCSQESTYRTLNTHCSWKPSRKSVRKIICKWFRFSPRSWFRCTRWCLSDTGKLVKIFVAI